MIRFDDDDDDDEEYFDDPSEGPMVVWLGTQNTINSRIKLYRKK